MTKSIQKLKQTFTSRIIRLLARPVASLGFPIARSRVYDCFIFYNELDLLEIRLNELYDYVDFFVLVESTETFGGDPKPLFYEENKNRFTRFFPKIRHIIVDHVPASERIYNPNNPSLSKSEYFQRRMIRKGIVDAQGNDVILISDIDEIPNPSLLRKHVRVCRLSQEGIIFKQAWFVCYLNARVVEMDYKGFFVDNACHWFGTMACTANVLRTQFTNDPNLVWARKWSWSPWIKVENGGWHFSWMGGHSAILSKIRSNACRTYTQEDWEQLALKHFNGLYFKFVDVDRSFPLTILSNIDRFHSCLGTDAQLDQLVSTIRKQTTLD
jgi:beta-1,4-mannosyl-glycoprotein beta-1,4-N-acetylglucosaminyltransferase